jgi:hypothetical protein
VLPGLAGYLDTSCTVDAVPFPACSHVVLTSFYIYICGKRVVEQDWDMLIEKSMAARQLQHSRDG